MANINEADFTPTAPSFKKLVYLNMQKLTNFPYIEADFDALTNYELLSKVVEYLNQVIANNNEQNEVVTNLYNAFVSLQDYVNNYFGNLDVQEEINNKLDEMASDGSLTNLIKQYVDPIYEAYESRINSTVATQNQTIETQNSNIQTLTTRMNTFTNLTEGSTTGDAELADIRVGYNGQKYLSAGQAVRNCDDGLFNETNSYIQRNRTINLFNKYDAIRGYYLAENDTYQASSTFAISGYIPCSAGDVLIPSRTYPRIYYDNTKTKIEYRSYDNNDFECPEGTAYARFSVLNAEYDTFVIYKSTGEGDTSRKYNIPYYTYDITGNIPEIKNAYLGYNNQLYFNLANSIQEQVKSLFNESGNYVNRTRTINLFDKNSAIVGYYLQTDGLLQADTSYAVSNFFEAEAGDVLIPSAILARCYYDSNKNLIEYRAYNNSNLVCPENTAYVRFTVQSANLNSFVIYKSTGEGDTGSKWGIPYYEYALKGEMNNFENETYKIFRKVCCIGDSLTEGYVLNSDGETAMVNNNYSWPHFMQTSSGNTYYNCGSSGANASTWLTRANGLQKAQNYGVVQAYLIALGFNDGLPYDPYHLDLGTSSDIGTENQTFYGCMSKIVREIHTISPNAFIFMQTIPSSDSRYTGYNEAIRYICNLYAETYKTHLLDLFNFIDLYTTPLLSGDSSRGHFTAIGYEVCSKNLQYIWSKYLNNNHEEFRDLPEYDI